MPLSEKRMAQLRSLAQPHLEPGEEVLSGAHGQHPGMSQILFIVSFLTVMVGALLYLLYGLMRWKHWELVLTDRRLLAIRVGLWRWNWLRPKGEIRSFPWGDMVSLELHRSLGFGDFLRFSTGQEEITYSNLLKRDLEDLRAALRSVRPDLLPA